MNPYIVSFLQKQTVASICTTDTEDNPYCFSCFYAFDAANNLLIYKTHNDTHHATLMLAQKMAAGTILPNKINPMLIKGVQWQGIVLPQSSLLFQQAATIYHKTFPFALAMSGTIWAIELTQIKMTDNSKGFGAKLIWNKIDG